MKKLLAFLAMFVFCTIPVFSEETTADDTDLAVQEIQANENKIIVVVQKQPLNENSKQTITIKKNWLGVYIQVNGKVKIQPLTNTYEVE